MDITDFNTLVINFDGDNDIDITDFNFLASNFAPAGYGATTIVPEPSSMSLFVVGLVVVTAGVVRRKIAV